MRGFEYFFVFQFALVVGCVLFLFHMLYRIVRAFEIFANAYAVKNTNKEKKE